MSRRLNMYGFSLASMRQLYCCKQSGAVERIGEYLESAPSSLRDDEKRQVMAIVERAIMEGVPFRDLGQENHLHMAAAHLLAKDQQEWLPTNASDWHVSALEDGLWKDYRKHARPEIKAFLRALVEGVPWFGQLLDPDGERYAAISIQKLRSFQPGLADLRDQVIYRAGRKQKSDEESGESARFASELCDWIDRIIEANKDLWYMSG